MPMAGDAAVVGMIGMVGIHPHGTFPAKTMERTVGWNV